MKIMPGLLRFLTLLSVLILWASPQSARADGKVFRPVLGADDPWIPDQRALLHWMDGEETLVIETSVNGGGADQELAWVVPLPSLPEVEEAPSGLFPLLAESMGPKIRTESPWWAAVITLTLLTWATLSRRGNFGFRVGSVLLSWGVLLVIIAGYFWSLGTVLALLLLIYFPLIALAWAGNADPAKKVCLKWLGIGGLSLGFIYFGLVASYGKIMAGGGGGIQVVGISQAGRFDVTLLKAEDPGAVAKWMAANGYFLPPETKPAVEAYVREGWVFAAMKTRREGDRSSGALHPVTFRFKAAAPVYPMRLTASATQGKPLGLDLFVFGPASASVPGMQVKRSLVTYPDPLPDVVSSTTIDAKYGRTLANAPGEIRRWFGNAKVGTWLRASIPVDQLSKDVLPVWGGIQPHDPPMTTSAGAVHAALNRASLVLGAFVFLLAIRAARRPWFAAAEIEPETGAANTEARHKESLSFWHGLRHHPLLVAMAALGLVWSLAYGVLLETTEVKHGGRGLARNYRDERTLVTLIAQAGNVVETLETTSPETRKASAAEEAGSSFGEYAVINGQGGSEYGSVILEESSRGTEIWFRTPTGSRVHIVTVDDKGRTDQRPGLIPLWDIPRSWADRIKWGAKRW